MPTYAMANFARNEQSAVMLYIRFIIDVASFPKHAIMTLDRGQRFRQATSDAAAMTRAQAASFYSRRDAAPAYSLLPFTGHRRRAAGTRRATGRCLALRLRCIFPPLRLISLRHFASSAAPPAGACAPTSDAITAWALSRLIIAMDYVTTRR